MASDPRLITILDRLDRTLSAMNAQRAGGGVSGAATAAATGALAGAALAGGGSSGKGGGVKPISLLAPGGGVLKAGADLAKTYNAQLDASRAKLAGLSKQQREFNKIVESLIFPKNPLLQTDEDREVAQIRAAQQTKALAEQTALLEQKAKRTAAAQTMLAGAFRASSVALGGFITLGLRGTTQGAMISLQFQELSRQIASVFLPTIEKVTRGLTDLANKFRSLTAGQQAFIENMAFGGVALLGSLVLFGKLAAAFKGLSVLLAVNPFVALAAGLVAMTASTAEGRAALTSLAGAFASLGQALAPVVGALAQVASIVAGILAPVFKLLADLLKTTFGDMLVGIGVGVALALVLSKIAAAGVSAATGLAAATAGVVGLGASIKALLLGIGPLGWLMLGLGALGGAVGLAGGLGGGAARGGGRRRELMLAGGGFEGLAESYKRFTSAAQRTADYPRQTADNTARTARAVEAMAARQPGQQQPALV